MIHSVKFAVVGLIAIAALGASVALTQDKTKTPSTAPKTAPQGAPQEMDPGMAAAMAAATPGPMHAFLTEGAGMWTGKNTLWMAPGTEPMVTDASCKIVPMLEGRFTRCEMQGEVPGMGEFKGFAIYGYDNVSKQFQCAWVDNLGTGMVTGTGSLSADGKTLTWTLNYNCPITNKPAVMREIDRVTGPDSRLMEMWGTDPQSGKEFKMMEMTTTRQPSAKAAGTR
jgi:hypothetical protein